MLGQPDGRGAHLSTANWISAEALAREVAPSLGVSTHSLLDEEAIAWSACAAAMQANRNEVAKHPSVVPRHPVARVLLRGSRNHWFF